MAHALPEAGNMSGNGVLVPESSAHEVSDRNISIESASLRRIFVEHEGYVSDKWEHYLPIYEATFSNFIARGQPIRLLEIGVQNGGSLQVWSKYLPQGSTIVGIDIDPACAGLPMEANISIRIGDATDPVALNHMLGDAEFDVIIDDGSHRSDQVIATFKACFKRLRPGGVYVIEDLHCSYDASHGGGFRRAGTSIEWLKGLVDTLNTDHFDGDAAAALDGAGLQRMRKFGSRIAQITFFDSVAIVAKLASEKRQPYRRIRTGREARVFDLTADIPLMPSAQLQTLLLPPSAAASFAPALLNAVASAREEVGRLRDALAQAEARHEGERRATSERAAHRAAEAESRLAEEARQRTEAEQRAEQAERRLAEEARQRIDAGQRAEQAERRLAEEARQRIDAGQRAEQAERRLAEEARQRIDAGQRAEQAERRVAEEARLRIDAEQRAAQLEMERDHFRREHDNLLNSTFWRLTGPPRRVASVLPPGLRKYGRRGARAVYWLFTPHRTGERIAYFRSRAGRTAPLPAPFVEPDPTVVENPVVGLSVSQPSDAGPQEPVITPPPISLVAGGLPGEVSVRAAAALAKAPWQPRPEQSQAVVDTARTAYQAARLEMIRGGDGELLAELRAAMSAWAAGEAGDASTEALIRAVGVLPLYGPAPAPAEHFPTPILRRYREAQIQTSQRLRLDLRPVARRRGAITVSILMPVYRTPLIYLERALLSVVCQTYQNWELCIVDNGSDDAGITAVLDYYEALDHRIRIGCVPENAGISAATNIALEMASGSYIGLLDSDDMLTSDALEVVTDHLAEDPTTDLLYTDECKIDENDIVGQLMPKPDWSPLLLTAFMYTRHFSVYRTSIVRELGGLRPKYDYSQDYDLALRVADLNPRVAHLRGYHYGWRMISGSASVGDKPDARKSNIATLQDAMDRRGWGGTAIAPAPDKPSHMFRRFEREEPLVSIVIPTGGNIELLSRCLSAILERTRYGNFEVIIVHNRDTKPEVFPYLETISGDPRVRIVDTKAPYNFSQSCNLGAAAAHGDVVLFYNDDVFVISRDWIESLLECLTISGVGAVSPKLLYENNSIQHAGMVTGTRRLLGTAFHGYPRDTSANMSMAQSLREVSLLSAACLAMRKTVFNEVGGFDEINTPREHSDVDLCLRIRECGYSCVYTPHAELTHIGHVTMGAEEAEGKVYKKGKHDIYIMKRFGPYIAEDPYFPEPMRDILDIDSPEAFQFFPRREPPAVEQERPEQATDNGGATSRPAAGRRSPALDILIFSHDLTESGAPRAAFDVARTLRNAGHFVVIISPSDGPFRERLRNIGVDVIVDELMLSQHSSVFDFARNFDKVICNTVVTWPVVAQLHEVVETYWYVHESETIRDLAEHVSGFASALKLGVPTWADSRLAARFLSIYGVEPRIIEYGVDDRAGLCPANSGGAGKIVIGVFGTYEHRKGQDLAVAAMLGLSQNLRDQAELRLFGRNLGPEFRDWKCRDNLEKKAKGERSIVFHGEVDHNECLRQMVACDVILVPSRDDALNFVALDALSLGKAVACSKTTGASEYLQDGSSALVLQENTPEEIGQVLARLIVDPRLRAALGEGARQLWARTFSLQSFAEKLHAALGLEAPDAAIPEEVHHAEIKLDGSWGNGRLGSSDGAIGMKDLQAAAATWNDPNESLESVNARIHDGVPVDQLEARADRYVQQIFSHFPYVGVPSQARCVEVGSGTGFIMQAMARALADRALAPQSIIGLDIAEHMLARARQRLGSRPPFEFLHYDGINVPLPDQSIDLIYSVAALQHVPKPYVYNLFFEIHRLLRPRGFAILHLLTFSNMASQERYFPWRLEVRQQVRHEAGHWHHYYSQEELDTVLRVGTGFPHSETVQSAAGIWACVAHHDPRDALERLM
jgi:O-antigen biosynthesis protein